MGQPIALKPEREYLAYLVWVLDECASDPSYALGRIRESLVYRINGCREASLTR